MSLYLAGASHTQFVRRKHVATTRQQLRTYVRLRALVEAWIAAGLELSALRFGTAPVGPRVRGEAVRRAAKRAIPNEIDARAPWPTRPAAP